eukprot:4383696-Ditylum_brightwellii.AAC.1
MAFTYREGISVNMCMCIIFISASLHSTTEGNSSASEGRIQVCMLSSSSPSCILFHQSYAIILLKRTPQHNTAQQSTTEGNSSASEGSIQVRAHSLSKA